MQPITIMYEDKEFSSNRKKKVNNRYCLPFWKARLCRSISIAFLFVAAVCGVTATAEAIVPGWGFSCTEERGCRQTADIIGLLPPKERAPVLSRPAAQARFSAYVARPPVRMGLAALVLLDQGLLVFMFTAVGLTLRHLGERGDHVLMRALPWLKRGAAAAVIWAVAQPLTDSLQAMLLSPGIPSGASWFFSIELTVVGPALLLSTAAYAIAWALEAGVRAQRDLADFV